MTAHYVEKLRVGLIQTSLDYEAAWSGGPRMSRTEEDRAILEINGFLAELRNHPQPPDIILLPELSVPRGYIDRLRKITRGLKAVIIAGLDYRDVSSGGVKKVRNEVALFVPNEWRGRRVGQGVATRFLGKTYPSNGERRALKKFCYGFREDPNVWVFDGGDIGSFAVAICYDFLDLERVVMYRGIIQHLFVLSYNKDTNSFDHAAEAMARMVFCNVVICNCGYWGGSLAVSPYRKPPLRTIYRHSGAHLTTAQVIELPVAGLVAHQNDKGPTMLDGTKTVSVYKGLPPGYVDPVNLSKSSEDLI